METEPIVKVSGFDLTATKLRRSWIRALHHQGDPQGPAALNVELFQSYYQAFRDADVPHNYERNIGELQDWWFRTIGQYEDGSPIRDLPDGVPCMCDEFEKHHLHGTSAEECPCDHCRHRTGRL